MNADFPRILTLLRKERNISQKQVAADLGISQALLSHYEKGIRECGLDFLILCADYYHVSCDYLLGRSAQREGTTITVEDIPEPDAAGRENNFKGSVLPVLNKKLIANSLNILFSLIAKSESRALVNEVSSFLMIAVYRMFRVVYRINPKNQEAMFHVPDALASRFADAAMQKHEALAESVAKGEYPFDSKEKCKLDGMLVTTESLNSEYPLFAPSLLNLIQTSEAKIDFNKKGKKR